jgi:N-methylhydantoinase A
MPAYAIGIDVGGTFTGACDRRGSRLAREGADHPRALDQGLMAALEAAAADVGRPLGALLGETRHFALGTTAVTNCLAQQPARRPASS